MWWPILTIVVLIATVWVVIVHIRVRRNLRVYWERPCMGTQWRARFPNATKDEIREFLTLFVVEMGFSAKRRLAFAPDDRVMDVYRALYPPQLTIGDSMELETIAAELQRRYGMDLTGLDREDVTLGEVFERTRTI